MAFYLWILYSCIGCRQKICFGRRKANSTYRLYKKTNFYTESAQKFDDNTAVYDSNAIAAEFGFNEWIKAQSGEPKGQNWQTWSAAMYLYAAKCVEKKRTPFFDRMRNC